MVSEVVSMLSAAALLVAFAACASQPKEEATPDSPYPVIGSVERLDPAIDALVPPEAQMEILAEGHEWTEGPVWVPAIGAVLYSDIPRNAIYQWKEGQEASVWLTPSGYTGEAERGGETGSNGLLLDAEGRIVLCQHGDRRMARLDAELTRPEPVFVPLAETYHGMRFNSPNDAVYASSGDLYFTDPPYGLEHGAEDPAKEIQFQGVYRLDTAGTVTLVTDELSRPNGIALSPDERTLYVGNSDGRRPVILAYGRSEDGSVATTGRPFFDASAMERGGFDGMKVDVHGNVYATGPGGVLVIAPDGRHLGTLLTTQATSNVAFGEDGSTLFITADMYLLRLRLTTKGLGF